MFTLGLPLALNLLLWPIALTLGQGKLTPPPVSAPGPSSSSSQGSISTAKPSASASVSATGNGSSSLSPSLSSSAMFPSLSGYSPCVVQCLGLTISGAGCNSVVDVQCFCQNTTVFTKGLVDCISQQCPSDLSAAETVSQQFCNVASPSVSLSFPSPSLSPSPSSSSLNSSASGTAPVSSGLLSNTSRTNSPTPSVSQTGSPSSALSMMQLPGLGSWVVLTLSLVAYSIALGQ